MTHTISSEQLARDLAIAFIHGVDRDASDRSQLPWMWEMPPPANVRTTLKEWVVVQMFLRSWGFRSHARHVKTAELLLDHFHAFAFEGLIQKGLFEKGSDTNAFLHERYQQYYDAVRGNDELQFQLLRITEAFFRNCGHMNMIDICAVHVLLIHRLHAERQLIIDLEKDVVIV